MANLAIRLHAWLSTAFHKDERGQDLVEYALWSGVIAIGLITIGAALYVTIGNTLGNAIADCVDFDTATGCAPLG